MRIQSQPHSIRDAILLRRAREVTSFFNNLSIDSVVRSQRTVSMPPRDEFRTAFTRFTSRTGYRSFGTGLIGLTATRVLGTSELENGIKLVELAGLIVTVIECANRMFAFPDRNSRFNQRNSQLEISLAQPRFGSCAILVTGLSIFRSCDRTVEYACRNAAGPAG